MSLRKQFAIDIEKACTGIAVEIVEAQNDDGTFPTFILASTGTGNKQYVKAMDSIRRKYRNQLRLDALSNEKSKLIYLEAFIDSVLKGWSYVPKSDVTGNQADEGYIEYSKEHAMSLLSDKAMEPLYERLVEEANDIDKFREEMLEEEAKN